jgi:thiopeptide-type bacteriocin biosynthesis protein
MLNSGDQMASLENPPEEVASAVSALYDQAGLSDTPVEARGMFGQDAVALVLESFRTDDHAALCAARGVSLEELAALRTSFIAGGAERIQTLGGSERWCQVNVSLDGLGLQWWLLMSGTLEAFVNDLRSAGAISEFHFVHKPPGLRLRFRTVEAAALATLDARLRELQARREISAWSRTLYDAEVYQFGGTAGLDVVHRFFTIETAAVMAYRRLSLQQRVAFDEIETSLLLLDALHRQATDDEYEVWDVWCKMELAGRQPQLPAEERAPAASRARTAARPILDLLRDPALAQARMTPEERAIHDRYCQSLPPVTNQLRAVASAGALCCPLREILPFVTIFHWNRMRFTIEQQRAISFLMSSALSPKSSS